MVGESYPEIGLDQITVHVGHNVWVAAGFHDGNLIFDHLHVG